jgi:hypothetical protein
MHLHEHVALGKRGAGHPDGFFWITGKGLAVQSPYQMMA